MLFAAVTVHIIAFLCGISDKPVARCLDISDFYAGLFRKSLSRFVLLMQLEG
jgi:hypothetical protein